MVNFTINGRELSAPKGTTILNAAEKAGIPIPHLCYLKDLNEIAACRMCMVEVEGTERLGPPATRKSWRVWSSTPTPPECGTPGRQTSG